jgi:hypothetical protein
LGFAHLSEEQKGNDLKKKTLHLAARSSVYPQCQGESRSNVSERPVLGKRSRVSPWDKLSPGSVASGRSS